MSGPRIGRRWTIRGLVSAPLSTRRARDRMWQVAATLAARLLGAYVHRGMERPTTYLHGGLAADDALFGYSDVDLCIVAPDHRREPGANRLLLQARWHRMQARLPVLGAFVDLMVWEEGELESAVRASSRAAPPLVSGPRPAGPRWPGGGP